MKGVKSFFICTECTYKTAKWLGKCPNCGAWNSFTEEVEAPAPSEASAPRRTSLMPLSDNNPAQPFSSLSVPDYMRSATGLSELDRVLGGGVVHGSVVLLSGEPGIGKSTLLMQISEILGKTRRVLYVSGEESGGQLKLRADRLGVHGDNLFLLTETNIERILAETEKVQPDFVIVDSIQTMWCEKINSAPGSVTQVREAAMALINRAKSAGISMLIVGHVNKEGGIAGPKVLEHIVDAVLCFEGERRQTYRIIRAVKNRYGSTNEIGVFEMTDVGLAQVINPSEMLLAGRPVNVSGSCAVCTMEGTRPIIAEIQSLVSQTAFPAPRRATNGVDYNRMCMILAVLEKRLGLKFWQNDVYLNVIGGLRLDEPDSDLAIALSLVSSITDRAVPDDLIAIGELGLAGEIRAVTNLDQRVREAARLGFTRALIPYRNIEKHKTEIAGIRMIPIKSIYEALASLKPKDKKHIEE